MGDVHNISLEISMVLSPLEWERWGEARALLHPALLLSDDNWPDVEKALHADERQLWVVLRGDELMAAALTHLAATREGDICEIHEIGGRDFRLWVKPLSEAIGEAAKKAGCIAMRAIGRFGWREILSENGWKPSYQVYEKALV